MDTRRQILKIPTLVLAGLLPGLAGGRKRKSSAQMGVIAGTVFQKTGFSLRGARVTITPVPADGGKVKKKQIQHLVTDSRGEYAARVPGAGLRYTVRVEAEGWQPTEKEVEVPWDQRVDVNFRLQPAPGGGTSK